MRVLVCGDRNWHDKDAIRQELIDLPEGTAIIHGAARGADTLAGEVASELGLTVIQFPADWTRYGRAAGPIRNRQMLNEGQPDKVVAFHPDIASSKGTKNMVDIASAAGIPVEVIPCLST